MENGFRRRKKRVNYPEMEFCKDRTAVLYSQADTIYRFTFYTRNDTLFLVDVNGNVVGNNRPDVQFDKHGVHTNVEYDMTVSANRYHYSA